MKQKDCNFERCINPLMIQSFNVCDTLNEYFAIPKNNKITKEDFMNLQNLVWRDVKKKLNLKNI